jgi:hypothetical protein
VIKKQRPDEWQGMPDFPASFLTWPALMAATAAEAIAASFTQFAGVPGPDFKTAGERQRFWATPHQLRLELGTMELRDFSTSRTGAPTLICASFALDGATVADFAAGHSVVVALCRGCIGRLRVTDWRSAAPEMRFLSIDSYLADLNVAVDELGPPVDPIGLCQGGWLALIFAARFPHKARRLVLVGAPVDNTAAHSMISQSVARVPMVAFEEFVSLQGAGFRASACCTCGDLVSVHPTSGAFCK